MSIFKHMTAAGGLRLLQSKTIRVTQPEALNDALECRPPLRGIAEEHELRAMAPSKSAIDRMAEEELDKALERLPSNWRAKLPAHFDAEHLRGLVLRLGITETTQNLTAALAGALGPIVGPLMHKKINELVGVLSFTSRVDSASMWDRYSDGNRGIAIEFNASHDFFHSCPNKPDSPSNLKAVTYETTRHAKNVVAMQKDELFFSKTDDWANEKELRMVRLLRDTRAVGTKDPNGFDVFVVDLPTKAVQGVVYGLNLSDDARRSIEAVLKDPSYAHVRRFEMQRVDFDARLQPIPIAD